MSEDEGFAFLLSGVFAVLGLIKWYVPLVTVTRLGAPAGHRLPLLVAPPACLAVLYVVLTRWAAREVAEGPEYVALFMTAGVAWVGLAAAGMRLLGIGYRDDAVERHNPAAAAVACGAVAGASFCFAGSNVGEGATIWTTFFPAVVSTGLLFGMWLVLEKLTNVSEAVTVDRDTASGVRLACLLAAAGFILGRAGAGDWQSVDATLADFARHGWPAAVLIVAAAVAQRTFRPTPRRPRPPMASRGLLPGTVPVLVAVAWVAGLGWLPPTAAQKQSAAAAGVATSR